MSSRLPIGVATMYRLPMYLVFLARIWHQPNLLFRIQNTKYKIRDTIRLGRRFLPFSYGESPVGTQI